MHVIIFNATAVCRSVFSYFWLSNGSAIHESILMDGWDVLRHCSDRRLQMIEFTTQAWSFCVCVCCASCFSDWSIIIDYSGKCVFLMLSPTLVQDHYVNNDFWFATTSTTTLLLWIKNEIDWNIVSTILFRKEKSSNLIISYFDKWLAIMCRTSRFFFRNKKRLWWWLLSITNCPCWRSFILIPRDDGDNWTILLPRNQ